MSMSKPRTFSGLQKTKSKVRSWPRNTEEYKKTQHLSKAA